MRRDVLRGVHIVFSGVLPLYDETKGQGKEQQRHQRHAQRKRWWWQQCEQFGASVSNDIQQGVTHIVCKKPGTSKTLEATRRGMWVVSLSWLERSMLTFQRLPESEWSFLALESHHRPGHPPAGTAMFEAPLPEMEAVVPPSPGDHGGHDTSTRPSPMGA